MEREETARLVGLFYNRMWNRWDEDTMRSLLAPDVVFRGSIGLEVSGHDGFAGYMATIRGAFPDFHNRIDDLVVEGSRAAARLTYTGTHRGPLFGHAATGRRVEYAGAAFFDTAGGQIARVWVLGDLWGLMRQVGAA